MIEVTKMKYAYKIDVDMDYIIITSEEWNIIKQRMTTLLEGKKT